MWPLSVPWEVAVLQSLTRLLWSSVPLVCQPVACCCGESLIANETDGSLNMGTHRVTRAHKRFCLSWHHSACSAFAVEIFLCFRPCFFYSVTRVFQHIHAPLLSGCVLRMQKSWPMLEKSVAVLFEFAVFGQTYLTGMDQHLPLNHFFGQRKSQGICVL